MSPQSSSDQPVQKQKFNVYTMMLIISFFCIVIACVLLWMELKQYGDFPYWNTGAGGGGTSQVETFESFRSIG